MCTIILNPCASQTYMMQSQTKRTNATRRRTPPIPNVEQCQMHRYLPTPSNYAGSIEKVTRPQHSPHHLFPYLPYLLSISHRSELCYHHWHPRSCNNWPRDEFAPFLLFPATL